MQAMYLLLLFFLIFPIILYLICTIILRPRPVKIPIKGRHVFISGGSSGIGLAIALQAVKQGARVSILARNIDKLEEARDSIRKATGIDVSLFSADVRDVDAIQRVVNEAGDIDVLICNHGVFYAQELDLQDYETVKFMVDVNLVGTLNLIKAALPSMKNRKGRGPGSIALMSSQAGQLGIYGYAAYSATKFGLRGLGEALQQELISDDIHVSVISPPETDTPGLVEANKNRPKMTKIIVASSGMMKADKVAEITLKGIQSGSFLIYCNIQGLLLSLGTSGAAPQRSPLMAVIGVVAAFGISILSILFQSKLYGPLEKWGARKRKASTT